MQSQQLDQITEGSNTSAENQAVQDSIDTSNQLSELQKKINAAMFESNLAMKQTNVTVINMKKHEEEWQESTKLLDKFFKPNQIECINSELIKYESNKCKIMNININNK